jgi:hypothetical protein
MVNREVFYWLLNMLARYGFLTYTDDGNLIETFEKRPFEPDDAAGMMVEAVKSNVIAVLGGFAGQWVGSMVGSAVMLKYGPFYPKVERFIRGSGSPVPAHA